MSRYKKIMNRFYSAPLLYGKTNLKPYMRFQCYFITEHVWDPEYIRQQAMQLLMSQCFGFYFFGAHSREWTQEFHALKSVIYPDADERCFLGQWDHINDFVNVLHKNLSCRPFVPSDIYLIYDDAELYQNVLDLLGVQEYD